VTFSDKMLRVFYIKVMSIVGISIVLIAVVVWMMNFGLTTLVFIV